MKKILVFSLLIISVSVVVFILMGELNSDKAVAANAFKACFTGGLNCATGVNMQAAYGTDQPTTEITNRVERDVYLACTKGNISYSDIAHDGMFIHEYECSANSKYLFVVYVAYGINIETFHAFPEHLGLWAPCGNSCASVRSQIDSNYEVQLAALKNHEL